MSKWQNGKHLKSRTPHSMRLRMIIYINLGVFGHHKW